jgi:thiol-disulfide isomerase/thioredoxin
MKFGWLVPALLISAGFEALCAPNPAVPSLSGRQLGGEPFTLETLRGKRVILHFFATWCPACQKEIPILEKAAARTDREKPEVILLSPESRRAERDLVSFQKHHPFRILLVEDLDQNDFGEGRVLPETVLIDGSGKIVKRIKGSTGDLETALAGF